MVLGLSNEKEARLKFYSTNNHSNLVSFREAVLSGIAADGGLFMPEKLPVLSSHEIKSLVDMPFNELSIRLSEKLLIEDLSKSKITDICISAFNFDVPLVSLNDRIYTLELFHGPTMAFKDFGARFMAEVMTHFNKDSNNPLTILVATSGDTGSAVANGFLNKEGIELILLYPSGKVSEIQEKQLTTLSGNVMALEILGTFDDCQQLVKKAFADKDLSGKKNLSSANSINIARLLPQSYYYFAIYTQLTDFDKSLIISVPSGNLGNLTAGLFAKEMGLEVFQFIAALNINDAFQKYLHSGQITVQKAIPTISNAMDVGNPSNLVRIIELYHKDHQIIRDVIFSSSFTDEQTFNSIKDIYNHYNYIPDTHGAVGYLALQEFISTKGLKEYNGVFLETAHPAKFIDSVSKVINTNIEMPPSLKECLEKEKKSVKLSSNFGDFKDFLLSLE